MNKEAGCGLVSFFLFVLLCLPSWLYAAGRVHLSELGISTGYASGEHRPEGGDFHVTSFALRAGFDLGSLQCSFDPFVNAIDADESGVEAGLTVFLRYFERLGGRCRCLEKLAAARCISVSTPGSRETRVSISSTCLAQVSVTTSHPLSPSILPGGIAIFPMLVFAITITSGWIAGVFQQVFTWATEEAAGLPDGTIDPGMKLFHTERWPLITKRFGGVHMRDLSTKYLGIRLDNPLVAASSGMTDTADKVERLAEAGIGAVVLKSLFEEQVRGQAAYVIGANEQKYYYAEAEEYIRDYSRGHDLADYLDLIAQSRKVVDIPVIASINCTSPSEWMAFARRSSVPARMPWSSTCSSCHRIRTEQVRKMNRPISIFCMV